MFHPSKSRKKPLEEGVVFFCLELAVDDAAACDAGIVARDTIYRPASTCWLYVTSPHHVHARLEPLLSKT